MVNYSVWYQKSNEDVLMWSENGDQCIINIVYEQKGGRTDLLEFDVLPSKASRFTSISNPSISRIVYLKNGSRKLPFMVVKTSKNMNGILHINCASFGYLLTLSSFNIFAKSTSYEKNNKAIYHLRSIFDLALSEQNKGAYVPCDTFNIATSKMTVSESPDFVFPSKADVNEKTLSSVFDDMVNSCGLYIARTTSTYDATTKKWKDTLVCSRLGDLSHYSPIYNFKNESIVQSYEFTRSIDDWYNGVYVYTESGKATTRRWGPTIADHLIAFKVDNDFTDQQLADIRTAIMDSKIADRESNYTTIKIDVNPILIEPGSVHLRMFDVVNFKNMGNADGTYIITGIKRYIDNPSKTKFTFKAINGVEQATAKYGTAKYDTLGVLG